MPVKIDGPAGRHEVTDEYRENYDRIFNGSSASRNRSHKAWQCPDPRKTFGYRNGECAFNMKSKNVGKDRVRVGQQKQRKR